MARKKTNVAVCRRLETERKSVHQVAVKDIHFIKNGEILFRRGVVVDVSATGILLTINRRDIESESLRASLTFESIHNEPIGFHIDMMETYIEGVVVRSKLQNKGQFQIAVDFRNDAPEYWRQAFVDILPED